MNIRQRLVRWFFGSERFEFERVVLSAGAARQITGFARRSHPREFSALLTGTLAKKTLRITDIIYQHFEASDRAAFMRINVPLTTDVKGSVHSHPTPNNFPSAADRRFFNKYGYVNFIIGYPYNERSIACYDIYGRPIEFEII
jgi:proteasome lid subunit RPN8/RPN11